MHNLHQAITPSTRVFSSTNLEPSAMDSLAPGYRVAEDWLLNWGFGIILLVSRRKKTAKHGVHYTFFSLDPQEFLN